MPLLPTVPTSGGSVTVRFLGALAPLGTSPVPFLLEPTVLLLMASFATKSTLRDTHRQGEFILLLLALALLLLRAANLRDVAWEALSGVGVRIMDA